MGELLGAIAAPLVGNLVGGLFGSHAAAPAAQAQSQAAGAESSLVNTIVNAYNQMFAPAIQQSLGQYSGLIGNVPIQEIGQAQIAQDLMPTYMPESMQAQGQMTIQNQADQSIAQLQQQLAQRGITGPAAEALVNQMREAGLQNQAGFASNVGQWEAGQTLSNRRNAFLDAMNMLGAGGQYAMGGNALVGAGLGGAQNLANMFGQAAGQAAAPYQQMGQQVGQAVQSWAATPQQPAGLPPLPGSQDNYQPLPQPSAPDSGNIYPTSAPQFWSGGASF